MAGVGMGAMMAARQILATAAFAVVLAGGPHLAAAQPAPASPQDLYNAGQAAFDRHDWPVAIDQLSRALAALKDANPSLTRAVINARLARAQLMASRLDDARRTANLAIGLFDAVKITTGDELADCYLVLGEAERYDLRPREAAVAYQRAIALKDPKTDPAGLLDARAGLALATMVTDPDTAAKAADAILNDAPSVKAMSPATLAQYETLRGRAELNRGHPKEALDFFKSAISRTGGLSRRITLAQESVRGDAAIATQLLNYEDATHQYLAYSGAGHLPQEDWLSQGSTPLPECGGPLDITPQDTAVVEFAIGENGRVQGAGAVYASRPGEMGVAFARAVRDWRWPPDTVKTLDPFWRAAVRLQLRCDSTTAELADSFWRASYGWLVGRDLQVADPAADGPIQGSPAAAALTDDRAEIAALLDRFRYHYEPKRAPDADLDRLRDLLAKDEAPPEARAVFAYLNALWSHRRPPNSNPFQTEARFKADRMALALPDLDSDPRGARSAAWLRTEMAIAYAEAHDLGLARSILTQVTQLPFRMLAENDDVRRVAVVQLVSLEAHVQKAGPEKDQGPGPQRCAVVDVKPVATNRTITDELFPREAMRWGFEGYVHESFDIRRDGSVENIRTVMAYPPFVFNKVTERAVAQFRFIPPIGPDGQFIGCVNQAQGVLFRLDASFH